jgi:2,4-dienoyl-CoA reductase-like NADH-dependent reductase (Old Yellow Enzyme family)
MGANTADNTTNNAIDQPAIEAGASTEGVPSGEAPSTEGTPSPETRPTGKKLFTPLALKRITLPHRILRAATFENMADEKGHATRSYTNLYKDLAIGGVGTIITGFNFTSLEGRAAQPFQAGIDSDGKTVSWKKVVDEIKSVSPETKLIMQISHTGRQTLAEATGKEVVGAGTARCTYFRSKVRELAEDEVDEKVTEYALAAKRAREAGFDAVQVHSAHGYLVHQFMSPYTNTRRDKWGKDRLLFLKEIVRRIREESDVPIFLKVSAADDQPKGLKLDLVKHYIKEIDSLDVEAIEISYGMMEIAFNIIRGGHPVEVAFKHNRIFTEMMWPTLQIFKLFMYPVMKKQFKQYADMYNLENAKEIKSIAKTPILVTGGIRSGAQITEILETHGLDGVTMSRPFVREADIVKRLREIPTYRSKCTNCNLCTVMCDSKNPLRCYAGKSESTRNY